VFCQTVRDYYAKHGRVLPWRETRDPYRILVSEIMLQQTQVPRVEPKYEAFVATFPDVGSLAEASLADVLATWQGLGYNRRAKSLQAAAAIIVAEHDSRVPRTLEGLIALPGIGHATAAQILAFAFDVPVPFIETNIRAVYLHHFFADQDEVPDSAIMPIVERTLDGDDPRSWYYALMDYGTWLKKECLNPSRRSKHHTTQSRFEGSRRQLRGRVLRALIDGAVRDVEQLAEVSRFSADETAEVVAALEAEGFLCREGGGYRVS